VTVILLGLETVIEVRLQIVLDLELDFGRVIELPIELELEVTMMPLNPPLSLPIPTKLKDQHLADRSEPSSSEGMCLCLCSDPMVTVPEKTTKVKPNPKAGSRPSALPPSSAPIQIQVRLQPPMLIGPFRCRSAVVAISITGS